MLIESQFPTIMMSFEREVIPAPNQEKKKTVESPVRTFEYKDAEGKKICDAIVELGEEELLPGSLDQKGRRIKTYKLRGEKDGQPTEVDLMQITGNDEFQASGYLTEGTKKNEIGTSKDGKIFVVLSSLEKPLDAATFLHEYGHVAQNHDERFKGINEQYGLTERAYNPAFDDFDSVIDAASKLSIEITPEQQAAMDATKGLGNKLRDVTTNLRVLQGQVEDIKTGKLKIDPRWRIEKIQDYESRISEALQQKKELEALRDSAIKILQPIIEAPMRILERDATARALKNMRSIRQQFGIDLLAQVTKAKTDLTINQQRLVELKPPPTTKCNNSIRGLVSNMWQRLTGKKLPEDKSAVTIGAKYQLSELSLFTYGARTADMRRKYGNIPTPLIDRAPNIENRVELLEDELIEELDAELEEEAPNKPSLPPPIPEAAKKPTPLEEKKPRPPPLPKLPTIKKAA